MDIMELGAIGKRRIPRLIVALAVSGLVAIGCFTRDPLADTMRQGGSLSGELCNPMFSADSRLVAVSRWKELVVYQLEPRKVIARIPGSWAPLAFSSQANAIAYHARGHMRSKEIRVTDLTTGSVAFRLSPAEATRVHAAAFDRTGNTLRLLVEEARERPLSLIPEGTLALDVWSLRTESRSASFYITHGKQIAATFSSDGRRLAVHQHGYWLYVYQTEPFQRLRQIHDPSLDGQVKLDAKGQRVLKTCCPKNGVDFLVASVDDKNAWRFTHRGYGVNAVAFAPNSRYLIIGSASNRLMVLDVQGQRAVATTVTLADEWGAALTWNFAVSPDGKSIATCAHREVDIWSVDRLFPQLAPALLRPQKQNHP